MGQNININTDELIRFTNKLEQVGRQAMPRTVQNVLNQLAFDVKKNTLPTEAKSSFENRTKGFFKKFSRVEMAKPGKIQNMKATVGMVSNGEQATEDQKQQQLGGDIKGRSLIPLDTARTGKSNKKLVRKNFRTKNLVVAFNTADAKGTTNKQRFVRTAIFAVERFGDTNILHTRSDGKTIIYNVKKGGKGIKTDKFNIKVTPLYTVDEGRTIKVKNPKPFTQRAAIKTARKNINPWFIKEAKRQLKKIRL